MLFALYRDVLSDCGTPLDSQTRILDFGCGGGAFVREGRSLGFEVYGCDFDATGEHIRQIEKPYRVPYPDGYFDVIFSNTVLEHVMDYHQALSELRRVTKPGGVFLHSFPARWIPIEPHTFVPLATLFRPYWWLWLWAALGVRNSFQAGLSASETARRNYNYLREHTNYLASNDLVREFERHFSVRFAERHFLRNSSNARGRRLAKMPLMPLVYRHAWNRVLFGVAR